MKNEIREILHEHARLALDARSLADDADLYDVGMTSHGSVNVMLALEEKFHVEFPDRMLGRGVFRSVSTIGAAIEELIAAARVTHQDSGPSIVAAIKND
jgi:acyl carrier protein